MTRSLLKRSATIGGVVAALTLAIAAPAAAHVTVDASAAVQGGYSTVTFKVPNESDEASTVKVEVNLPRDAPIASVSVRPVPGWTVVPQKSKLATPVEAHGVELTEAVSKITWTASGDAAVKPGEFQTFDVSLGPLPKVGQMVFKTLQTYSDGTIVRWIDEPSTDGTEPESPAPVLKLAAEGAAAAGAPAGTSTAAPTVAATPAEDSSNISTAFGIAGTVLGLAGLILGLLAYRRSGRAAAPVAAEREAVSAGTGSAG